ncbi:MAG TPA: thioredoxin family protein [Pseudorhizobium sp.]|jgi:hypothetical protein|nr:thioredoxin family protein [Pseudorhizobium sp.]
MPLIIRRAFFVVALALAGTALAEEGSAPKGVVELFTSQGCSSCPPADTALKELVQQGDVVALSYHVDYWNYLGWTDTLSSKENTDRQYGYAHSLGRSGVYTPQAVINGRDHVKGTELAAINNKIASLARSGEGLTVPVQAHMRGKEIEIKIGAGKGDAEVVVAYFTKRQHVEVDKGENAGKRMEYWHSVYDVQSIGIWDGKSMTLTIPGKFMGKGKKDGCAVLLQTSGPEGEPGAILGATVLMAGRHKR